MHFGYPQLLLILSLWLLTACTPATPPAVPATPSQPPALPSPASATITSIPIPSTPSPTPTFTPDAPPSATPALPTSALPTPTQTPLACLAAGGSVVTYTLETGLAPYPLDVRVYLPPCYQQQPDQAYPVLYLIHGQSFNDDQWDRLGMDETADRLIAAGELAPFLIVMPRDREWTPSNQDPFGRMFMEFLLPWVGKTFRILPERQYQAVGGLSRGAGWAVHFGLRYSDRFGSIGAHSLATFWTDTPKLGELLQAIPPDELPRIYLDMGDQDREEIIKSATWFEAMLTKYHIPHEWYMFRGQHNELYWGAHVERYLRWYAADW